MVVVSPRNYFLYTPLLPAVAVGTMEERRWVVEHRAEAECLMLRLLALVKRAAGCSTSIAS